MFDLSVAATHVAKLADLTTLTAVASDIATYPSVDLYVSAFDCVECNEISTSSAGCLYECRTCSIQFSHDYSIDGNSNRCPDCARFAARIADDSCAECGHGKVIEIEAVECPECGELVRDIDWFDHWTYDHDNPTPDA